jgi:hypothetical protein
MFKTKFKSSKAHHCYKATAVILLLYACLSAFSNPSKPSSACASQSKYLGSPASQQYKAGYQRHEKQQEMIISRTAGPSLH